MPRKSPVKTKTRLERASDYVAEKAAEEARHRKAMTAERKRHKAELKRLSDEHKATIHSIRKKYGIVVGGRSRNG